MILESRNAVQRGSCIRAYDPGLHVLQPADLSPVLIHLGHHMYPLVVGFALRRRHDGEVADDHKGLLPRRGRGHLVLLGEKRR